MPCNPYLSAGRARGDWDSRERAWALPGERLPRCAPKRDLGIAAEDSVGGARSGVPSRMPCKSYERSSVSGHIYVPLWEVAALAVAALFITAAILDWWNGRRDDDE